MTSGGWGGVRGYCAMYWRAQEIPGNESIFARKNEKPASVTQIF